MYPQTAPQLYPSLSDLCVLLIYLYKFVKKNHAAFVNINCVQHITHDFSESDIAGYFKRNGNIQKLGVIHLEYINQYIIYWIEDQKYTVYNSLVFKCRSGAIRFTTMRRYHEIVLNGM